MSEHASTPSVGEKAEDRFRAAYDALRGMEVDLVTLAEPAVHRLHREAEDEYAAHLAAADPRFRAYLEGTPDPIRTWPVPGTAYHLPDWKASIHRGFFDPKLEHTLIQETRDGDRLISFNQFVRECSEREYVTVCQGLSELVSPASPAKHSHGDGLDND